MIHAKEAKLLYDLSFNNDLYLIDALIRVASCSMGPKRVIYNVSDLDNHHKYIDILLSNGYSVTSSKSNGEIKIEWDHV